MTDRLSNSDARRLFLSLHELSRKTLLSRKQSDIPELVERLGFVQIDSIRTMERAHHHILASRVEGYKPSWLDYYVEHERSLFENWTHDASFIPLKFFPYWKPRFERAGREMFRRTWWKKRMGQNAEHICQIVLNHVAENGPVMARDLTKLNGTSNQLKTNKTETSWWGWHPSKAALVFLWRTGKLAVTARRGFQKVYDLTERVIPQKYREFEPTEAEYVNWSCVSALERIGFGEHSEIARFWESVRPAEVRRWYNEIGGHFVRQIAVEDFNGDTSPAFGHPDLFKWLKLTPEPSSRIRFLSPFDPMIRDRKRANRLFGFNYKIEIYVPKSKRIFGYYVYPILERDELIGRIEIRANRSNDSLEVHGIWLEPKIEMSKQRKRKLESELERWRRYTALSNVTWLNV